MNSNGGSQSAKVGFLVLPWWLQQGSVTLICTHVWGCLSTERHGLALQATPGAVDRKMLSQARTGLRDTVLGDGEVGDRDHDDHGTDMH